MYDAEIGEVFTLSSKTKADPRWWGGEPVIQPTIILTVKIYAFHSNYLSTHYRIHVNAFHEDSQL